jgi:2'-5' RNA ligase
VREAQVRRTVEVSTLSEGARHGQQGQASSRGEEAEEVEGRARPARSTGSEAAAGRAAAQLRLFVALYPPRQACDHLAAHLGLERDPRWHLTLAFLGESGPVDLSSVEQPPLTLRLAGAVRLGKVAAVGVGGDVAGLRELAGTVQSACGVSERRPYRPHLTVGRWPLSADLAGYVGPDWLADEVALVQSTLGRPVVHEVLQRWGLRRASSPP